MVRYYNYRVLGQDVGVLASKEVVIWGISVSGLEELVHLKSAGVIVKGFTDSYVSERGNTFASYPIMTYDEIINETDICIVISTRNVRYLRDILAKCEKLRFSNIYAHIFVYGPAEYDITKMCKVVEEESCYIDYVRNHLNDDKSVLTFNNLLQYRMTNNSRLIEEICEHGHIQYFPGDDIFSKNDSEVFVDAGGYNGDTSVKFFEWVDSKYKNIYIMEPDPLLFEVSKEYIKLKSIKDVCFVNKGAYSKKTIISFCSDSDSGSSRIADGGNYKIETITIDEMLAGDYATYIKMDIEGAEYEALLGCDRTIDKFRPKLAISIYHKEKDLWKIPYYLMKKYPYYKFYIRHYTDITTETILYATAGGLEDN